MRMRTISVKQKVLRTNVCSTPFGRTKTQIFIPSPLKYSRPVLFIIETYRFYGAAQEALYYHWLSAILGLVNNLCALGVRMG